MFLHSANYGPTSDMPQNYAKFMKQHLLETVAWDAGFKGLGFGVSCCHHSVLCRVQPKAVSTRHVGLKAPTVLGFR